MGGKEVQDGFAYFKDASRLKARNMSSLNLDVVRADNWLLALPSAALDIVCLHLNKPARARLRLSCTALRTIVNNSTGGLRFTPENTVFQRGRGSGTRSLLGTYFPRDLPDKYPSVNKIAFEGWDLKDCKGNSHEAVVLHIATLPWHGVKQLILTGSTVSPALVTCITSNLSDLEAVTLNAEPEPDDAHSTPAYLQVSTFP
jgi:hypothetical protein